MFIIFIRILTDNNILKVRLIFSVFTVMVTVLEHQGIWWPNKKHLQEMRAITGSGSRLSKIKFSDLDDAVVLDQRLLNYLRLDSLQWGILLRWCRELRSFFDYILKINILDERKKDMKKCVSWKKWDIRVGTG